MLLSHNGVTPHYDVITNKIDLSLICLPLILRKCFTPNLGRTNNKYLKKLTTHFCTKFRPKFSCNKDWAILCNVTSVVIMIKYNRMSSQTQFSSFYRIVQNNYILSRELSSWVLLAECFQFFRCWLFTESDGRWSW